MSIIELAKNISLFNKSNIDIETSLVTYFMKIHGIGLSDFNQFDYTIDTDDEIYKFLKNNEVRLSLEELIDLFESLIEDKEKAKYGIVFTPRYISDFMLSIPELPKILEKDFSVIDPSCGGGIFLVSAAQIISENYKTSVRNIVENHLYGIDIREENVRFTKVILELLCLLMGENTEEISINIKKTDSLKSDWNTLFNRSGFDLIIGNPPYFNTHDMSKEYIEFLKSTFNTTKSGVFNVFYAFIEYGAKFLKNNGRLCFIIPNNFLTIKTAEPLRKFIQDNLLIEKIIDFGENMIFKPIRTYNCIMVLNKEQSQKINYFTVPKVEDIKSFQLKDIEFETMESNDLNYHTWNLVDRRTRENIKKIEGQSLALKNFIRTGIATLRDEVFTVKKDKDGFYKMYNDKRYNLNEGIVRKLYKIPEIKEELNLENVERYIIFPYTITSDKLSIIPEEIFIKKYVDTYNYLIDRKSDLDSRDKGKPNKVAWYAYGRSQGLLKLGKKLVFPTFSNYPRFIKIDDELALFCNGYAIFEDSIFDIDLMSKVLNTDVMDYYVKNTSYCIEGGYYCYQKKYIERFTLPRFDVKEKEFILKSSADEVNSFLIKRYGIDI